MGIIRPLSTKVLWLQQLVQRGVVTVGACTSALGDTPSAEAVEKHGVGRTELRSRRMVTKKMHKTRLGKEGLAAQTVYDPGQGDGGVQEALGNIVRAVRGTKEVSGHRCQVPCDKWLPRSMMTVEAGPSGTQKDGLSRGHTVSGRLVHGCWQKQSPCCDCPQKVVTMELFGCIQDVAFSEFRQP